MSKIELLATEYEFLLDIRESIEELDNQDLLDKACHEVEKFREQFAPELPEILAYLNQHRIIKE